MKKNNQLTRILQVFIIIAVVSLGYWYFEGQQPGDYDKFAQCLSDKGAKFYGAFWCPHCQAQKALFGKSKTLLPYVECSTADSKGQTQICKDKNIVSYPTWSFPIVPVAPATSTEEFVSGEQSLEELAAKTGCEIK